MFFATFVDKYQPAVIIKFNAKCGETLIKNTGFPISFILQKVLQSSRLGSLIKSPNVTVLGRHHRVTKKHHKQLFGNERIGTRRDSTKNKYRLALTIRLKLVCKNS